MRIFRSCFYFFSLYSRAVFQGYFTNKRNMNKLELHSFGMIAAGVGVAVARKKRNEETEE